MPYGPKTHLDPIELRDWFGRDAIAPPQRHWADGRWVSLAKIRAAPLHVHFKREWSILMLAIFLCVFRFVRLLGSGQQAIAIENLALRRQLAAYKRKRKRPALTQWDRVFWVALSQVCSTGYGSALATRMFSPILGSDLETERFSPRKTGDN